MPDETENKLFLQSTAELETSMLMLVHLALHAVFFLISLKFLPYFTFCLTILPR